MSYCHYWGRPAELAASEFRAFARECVTLRRALGVPLLGLFGGVKICGASGWRRPTFREDGICFNGRPGHEALVIRRVYHQPRRQPGDFGLYWDYVSTSEKPYDDSVVASLLSFKHHFPAAALSSDGGKQDWARGIALYESATGRLAPDFPALRRPVEI